jgi:hypothetical protein
MPGKKPPVICRPPAVTTTIIIILGRQATAYVPSRDPGRPREQERPRAGSPNRNQTPA